MERELREPGREVFKQERGWKCRCCGSLQAGPALESVTHDARVETAAPCLSVSRTSLIRRLERGGGGPGFAETEAPEEE